MEPMAPDTPISVTLQAQEWNAMLSVLVDAPYKMVAGLVAQITEQAQRQAQQGQAQQGQLQPGLPLTNGADYAHP
jgi:hypothetical protein